MWYQVCINVLRFQQITHKRYFCVLSCQCTSVTSLTWARTETSYAFYYYRLKFLVEKMCVSILGTLLQILEIAQLLIYLFIKRNGTIQTNVLSTNESFQCVFRKHAPGTAESKLSGFENVKYTTTLLCNGLCPRLLPFHLFKSLTRQPYGYKYSLDRTTETHFHEARWIEWQLSHLSRKFGPNRHLKKRKCRQISLSSYLVVVSAVVFEASLIAWT